MQNNKLDLLFPTAIWKTRVQLDTSRMLEEMQKSPEELGLTEESHWICNTYNTSKGSYNLLDEPVFGELIDIVLNEVQEFAKEFGIYDSVITTEGGWANIAPPGSFQEYHIHPVSHFSAVYYLDAIEGSGDIVFRHPKGAKMFPLEPYRDNLLQHSTFSYTPEVGMLLIFRSDLEHLVNVNNTDKTRISIAFNYKVQP